ECWTMAAEKAAAAQAATVDPANLTAEQIAEIQAIQDAQAAQLAEAQAAGDSPKNSPEPKTAGRDTPIAIIALIALLADGYIVFFEDRNDDF
ncbi:MAG: hypothetical protein K5894_02475, partial [Lachnospiraceae bacterium]|nr:hypothetical protein [Lachnospiraceae bacterium]